MDTELNDTETRNCRSSGGPQLAALAAHEGLTQSQHNTLVGHVPTASDQAFQACSAPHMTSAMHHTWRRSSHESEAISHTTCANQQSCWQSQPCSPRRCPPHPPDHSTATLAHCHHLVQLASPAQTALTVLTAPTMLTATTPKKHTETAKWRRVYVDRGM